MPPPHHSLLRMGEEKGGKMEENLSTTDRNVKIICQSIKKESDYKVKEILNNAENEAKKILQEAKNEGEKEKEEILKELEKDLREMKGKSLSSLNMEKKRIILEEEGRFFKELMDEVKKDAFEFRRNKEYKKFLKRAIIEGIKVIGKEKVIVFYSPEDEKIFSKNFPIKDASIEFKKGDFKDIGVIISSENESITYDNRFSSRLKRVYDEIYVSLIREVFNA